MNIKGLVKIGDIEFNEIEGGFGENKKSILVKDIAIIHGRELRKVNELINNNRKRFIDHKDIIDFLNPSEGLRDFAKENGLIGSNRTQNVYLLSERGYSKLLKIMDDDLAWEKYDEIVDNYFTMREIIQKPDSYMIEDKVARAKRWIEEEEERIKLANENKILKPKGDYYDKVLKDENLLTVTQIAQDYGFSANKLNKLLQEYGIQYKQSKQWILYSKYKDEGYVKSQTSLDKNGEVRTNTKWTQKGKLFIYKLLKEKGISPIKGDE